MKMTFLLLSSMLVLLAWGANTNAADPFTLSIVPSRSSTQAGSLDIREEKSDEFFVVLSNTSKDAQPVFEYWNTWGHGTIRFEITMPDGEKRILFKGPRSITRDSPTTFLIQPGEHQIYPLHLDNTWSFYPKYTGTPEEQITLKAIYQVSATPQSSKYNVWTGRIESKAYSITLRY